MTPETTDSTFSRHATSGYGGISNQHSCGDTPLNDGTVSAGIRFLIARSVITTVILLAGVLLSQGIAHAQPGASEGEAETVQSSGPAISGTEAAAGAQKAPPSDTALSITLSTYEYLVNDTAESVSFRLYVRNNLDSLVVIERVDPSCGCILATVQKSFVHKGHDGEIYIGLMVDRMNDYQPFTVDVYTSANRTVPLRLYIRKASGHTNDKDD